MPAGLGLMAPNGVGRAAVGWRVDTDGDATSGTDTAAGLAGVPGPGSATTAGASAARVRAVSRTAAARSVRSGAGAVSSRSHDAKARTAALAWVGSTLRRAGIRPAMLPGTARD